MTGYHAEQCDAVGKFRAFRNSTQLIILKPVALTIALLSLAAFGAGCDREPCTSQQLDKVKTETKQAARDVKDYTFAQKAEFTQNLKNELAVIHSDLDQLAAGVEKSSEAARAEARPKLKALREQAARLDRQLAAVKDATESTWDTFKRDTREARDGFQETFQHSRQWLSDKIAP